MIVIDNLMKLYNPMKINIVMKSAGRVLALALILLAAVVPAQAHKEATFSDPASSGIAEGEKLYKEHKYAEAVSCFAQVAEMEGVSAPLLYNLGNAYYRAGQQAKAVICYERALKLDPSNDDISNNLQYVYTRIDDMNRAELKGKNLSVSPDSPSFFSAMYYNVAVQTSSNFWALLAAFAFILMLGAIALYIFAKRVPARKVGFFSAFLFGFCAIVFLVLAFTASREYHSKDKGVVTAYKVELLTEPKSDAKPSTPPLNAGTKLQILETQADEQGNAMWYKVRLNSDFLGWIPAKEFEVI